MLRFKGLQAFEQMTHVVTALGGDLVAHTPDFFVNFVFHKSLEMGLHSDLRPCQQAGVRVLTGLRVFWRRIRFSLASHKRRITN